MKPRRGSPSEVNALETRAAALAAFRDGNSGNTALEGCVRASVCRMAGFVRVAPAPALVAGGGLAFAESALDHAELKIPNATLAIADRVELVWSGTEVTGSASRDTSVVVQELFREARESVLIASYALDTGSKAEALFGLLATRMDAEPDLHVRLFVNVHRKHGDVTADVVLLREFADTFRQKVWPGERLPDVFYDPRSLASEGKKRASLHAKCIVIDEDRALITSANFTEAAHERNIEAGAVITDTILSRALKAQFDTLVDHGVLKRVPGL